MSHTTQVLSSAAILLTGLPGSGKTTLAHALVRRLISRGIKGVVLIDEGELSASSMHRSEQSLTDQEAAWFGIIEQARNAMKAGKVVIIASVAQRVSMRVDALILLKPFYEVHLNCPVETCVARDRTFAGMTHAYELSAAPDLRLDTAALSRAEAEAILVEGVIAFLSRPIDSVHAPSLVKRIARRLEDYILDSITESKLHWKTPERRRQDLLRRAPASRAVVKMERASCAQLVVLYGGMDAFLSTKGKFDGMRPLEFIRQSGLFGRNLTWIRDPYGDNFMQGVSASINDAEALAEWTRSYARSLSHVREVHAIGYSSGCYGALMFGHMCRMQTVWAFSPRSSSIEKAAEARAYLKNMLSVHNGVTQYHIWYSYKNKYDGAFAEFLADCPNVTLHPSRAAGSRHALIRYLAENGALRLILPPFVSSNRNPERMPKDGLAALAAEGLAT